ncbi:Uridine phosphorylase [Babesia sp. Xinjiang]|uniref:Uridine phosphorylase n=1 Tax=Babesia sp. Xinjiang TaxID=462227 RepID=UPI000A2659EC|nr:Uridine phosphorylase [Babesia sp. Xinjiang]ORM41892.1 Uridine phosphorylase [Babesia sp. Xinjiang]
MPKTAICPKGIMNKTGLPLDRIHPVAVVVGDTKWLDLLASLATRQHFCSRYKSLCSVELEYAGQTFFALSFGYGATNLHRLLNELGIFGVRCVILITNTVSLHPGRIPRKMVCVTYASCRGENTSNLEVDITYPAVAHPDAIRALREASSEMGVPCRLTRSFTHDATYPPLINRVDTLRQQVMQTGLDLEDREISTFLVFCGTRGLVAGVISCNGTEPSTFDPETGAPIEDDDVIEARKQTMRIALLAASRLCVDYDFTEGS